MLTNLTIKDLYVPALTEGEGVGTAYEYFAKRQVLARWLRGQTRPRQVLVAGLPEKYGASLDFLLLAHELGAAVTAVDDRSDALERLTTAVAGMQQQGWLTGLSLTPRLVRDVAVLDGIEGPFDLSLSSEVLQRLDPAWRGTYLDRVWALATAVALFCPNADNPSHTNISGLSGLHLSELEQLFLTREDSFVAQFGYIDMPPFPPGITRSEEQRAQASSGRFEALAMWGLGYYARAEKWLPGGVRRKQSHIVYALARAA